MVDAEPRLVEAEWHTGRMETARSLAIELLEGDDDEYQVRAGTMLIAPIILGFTSYRRLNKATGIPLYDVCNIGYRFRAAGIWEGPSTMNYLWLDEIVDGDPLAGQIGFVLDVMVGTGDLVKIGEQYRASRVGEGQGAPDPSTEGMPLRSSVVTKRTRGRKRLD